MKKVLLMFALLTASSSFAATYTCMGLDNVCVAVEVGSEPVYIGTLEGAPVNISDDGELVSVSIKQGDLVNVISAKSGAFNFHQNDGKKAVSLNCLAD